MSLVTAFAIAAVLVSPFAWVTVRRVLRERAARRAADAPPPEEPHPTGPPDVADAVAAARDEALAAIEGAASGVTTIEVPEATIGGRIADRAIVEALVIDDLRRRGLRVEVDGPGRLRVEHSPG